LIAVLLAWILISLSFLGWGKLLAAGFGPPKSREDFSETGYFFLGMSIAGILSGIWWIFAPVSIIFGGSLLGVGLGYVLASGPIRFEIRFQNPWFSLAMLLILGSLLMKAAAPTAFYDCGLYYGQTLRWMQGYAAVPGLGNLHIRFGNASAWHMLSAAFDWPALFQGSFDDLGELVLFWFVLFHGWNTLKLEGFERFLSLGLVLFALYQCHGLLTAPSPDLVVGVLGMQTIWQFRKFLRLWNPRQPNQLNTRGLALLTQSLFLAEAKLSAIPFLLIAVVVLFLVTREGWYLRIFQLGFLGFAVLMSMILRSYLLSGYLVFPVLKGPFSPDWLVSEALVQNYLNGVRGFARHILSDVELRSGLNYETVGGWPFKTWFPVWASERKLADWISMLGGISGWLLLVDYASRHIRKSFRSHWPLIFFTWLCGMMLLFWFSNAPDVRFGIAILGTGCSYALASLLVRLPIPRLSNRVSGILLVIPATAVLWFYRDKRTLENYVLFPSPYPEVQVQNWGTVDHPVFTPVQLEHRPGLDADQCWNAPLPCSMEPVPGLEFRGKSLSQGFRLRTK
jgi:hypothetical protein